MMVVLREADETLPENRSMTVCDVIHASNTVLQNCGGKEDIIQSCFDVIATKCQGP